MRARASLASLVLLLLALSGVAGCDLVRELTAAHDVPTGGPCEGDGDCEDGVCIGGITGDAPVCTPSCDENADCPEGWSCSGVTGRDLIVCQPGSATPFGY